MKSKKLVEGYDIFSDLQNIIKTEKLFDVDVLKDFIHKIESFSHKSYTGMDALENHSKTKKSAKSNSR
jgi:hypothetical protein